ncbi:MAG: class I SAM-dependent methyltransferase [Clostridiales bacterium]|nr:class I SAM-dependent methyltransferase [Clostridiales bacterium]
MLKVAKNKVGKTGLKNMRLHQMDATSLKFKDACFDKILISLVLHELDEELAGKLLQESKRVLKADGEIIITEWERSPSFWKRLLFMPIHCVKHCDYTKVIILKKCVS